MIVELAGSLGLLTEEVKEMQIGVAPKLEATALTSGRIAVAILLEVCGESEDASCEAGSPGQTISSVDSCR